MKARALLLAPLLLLPFACASGGDERTMMEPRDYDGPTVVIEPLDGGGVTIAMQAPTAGHRLSLLMVRRTGDRAVVHVRHDAPTDFVAQVVSELTLDVAAQELGDSKRVTVMVSAGDEEPRLAVEQSR